MLYTPTPQTEQNDRIRLFTTMEAARAHARDRRVYRVAARFDPAGRRLVALVLEPDGSSLPWTTPTQLHGDGSITARGPIPGPLYIGG